MTKHRVTATDGLNVRTVPTPIHNVPLGVLPLGAIVEVIGATDNGWYQIGPVTAGGATLAKGQAFAISDYLEKVTDPPPPVSTRKPYRIGVHVIGDWRAADLALQAGAPVIFGMHGHLEMVHRARAYPDRIFIYRGWVPGGSRPTPRDVFNLLQVGRDDPPNIWYVGTNENDHYGDDPEALRGRVLWDKDLFYMLRDVKPGVRYFGLSLGHGCPGGIEDPNGPVTAALMGYSDLWNEGMGIDLHNYTKGKRYPDDPVHDSPINHPAWYEKRHLFWFRNGILDPRKGGGFIHGETGVEANHGGHKWAGYTRQQFGRHIRTLSDFGRESFTVESGPYIGTYPSVEEAGALFMFGEDQTWTGGYDTRPQIDELRAFWAEGR